MSFVIASQLEPTFNERLAAHPARPQLIAASEERPWEAASEADVLIVRPSPSWRGQRDAAQPPGWPGRLRWISSASAGIDYYPRWLLAGPPVSCGRGVASDEIAEYVLAAIFRRAKDLESVRMRARGDFKHPQLGRLRDSVVGIVGLGAIGGAVAARALSLGARVVAVRRRGLPSAVPGVGLLPALEDVVRAADHLVLALPATDATRGLFDRALFAHAKPGAHLINVARGSLIDQAALLDALEHGPLGFATLDVTEPEPLPDGHPLYAHPRVLVTPHVASNYLVVRDLLFAKISNNLERLMRGEPLHDLVDPSAGY